MFKTLIDFLATGFYSGRSRVAPGTAGTAAAFVIALLLSPIITSNCCAKIIVAIIISGLGMFVCFEVDRTKLYGDNKDPQQIVIDEFAGFFIAISFFPWTLSHLLIGFLLFRFFDITKFPPIRRLETVPYGFGIMLDDMLAGVYALCCGLLISNFLL